MTQEEKELLKSGNDMLIANVSNSIGQTKDPQMREAGRQTLKKLIALSDKIDKIKIDK
jgi:hypothetical protein